MTAGGGATEPMNRDQAETTRVRAEAIVMECLRLVVPRPEARVGSKRIVDALVAAGCVPSDELAQAALCPMCGGCGWTGEYADDVNTLAVCSCEVGQQWMANYQTGRAAAAPDERNTEKDASL